jgi:two-component system, NarL family, response regulator NreC
MIRVLIADDHNVFVEGIDSLLHDAPAMLVVGRCYDVPTVKLSLLQQPVDVVLLDISFPHIEDGLALCEHITQQHPLVRVVALTMHDDASLVKRMVKKGAKGYLLKNTTKAELLTAIEAVHAGKRHFNEAIMQVMLTDVPRAKRSGNTSVRPSLTPREAEVLYLISEGMTNQQIADKLFVSIKAIEFHRSSLLLKFGVPNTALLIKTAMAMAYIE